MQTFAQIAQVCGFITTIAAAIALFVKPIRRKLFGMNDVRDGQKCLLRSNMLRTYYRNRPQQSIRQYEYENFVCEYKAYKALRGNSFVDRIYREIQQWEVIT